MAKKWSMDEIDDLLETTKDSGVSDLVAELTGSADDSVMTEAEAEEAVLSAEEVLAEADAVDEDDYDYDFDDFDEDDEPDVEGVEELLGTPVEEEPEPVAEEPELSLFDAEDETPAAEEPVAKEPVPEEAAPVTETAAEAPDKDENLSDETDYAPGFVDEESVSGEESQEGRPSFMNRLRAFRESFINVVEGSESDEGFTDEDYGLDTSWPSHEDGIQRMTGREKFMDRKVAYEKTKVFEPLAESAPAVPRQVREVREKSVQFKGLDENAKSPKMIMELADDKPQPEEKKALAQKTVGIRPIRNENIEHQILTTKIERTTAEFTRVEDEEMPSAGSNVKATPKGTHTTVASASAAVAAAAAAAVAAVRG
ncbi:MAG: hypothetical protein J6T14_04680, partial [Clostridia bacterium]|nr:hypothetical protein [Clostridia bacterium]